MAPFYESTTSTYWNWPAASTASVNYWTTSANFVLYDRPSRLRLPPPSPIVRRGALPIRPRRPHAVARVEAVRRGRAEARPSRALRQRRRRARARA